MISIHGNADGGISITSIKGDAKPQHVSVSSTPFRLQVQYLAIGWTVYCWNNAHENDRSPVPARTQPSDDLPLLDEPTRLLLPRLLVKATDLICER